MKRCFVSLAALMLLGSLARGHFIWVVPEADGKAARVFFSDNLTPDDAKLLAKIAKTEVFVRDDLGRPEAVKWTQSKDVYRVELPAGKQPGVVTAACTYGVVQRGKSDPFLLHYNASAHLKPGLRPSLSWVWLGLEVLHEPNKDNRPLFRVLWQGKPLPDAEVLVLAPGEDKGKELKTNKEGFIDLGTTDKAGLYGLRARHVIPKTGKHDGKEYKEVRHYSTLVFRVDGPAKGAAAPVKADPAATKLLADARAARATWKDFPGFTADVTVNFDGKVGKGKAHVGPSGKVRLEGLDAAFEPWARRELASLVGHRLDSGSPRDTPCAFLDNVTDHPFGRAIRVLNDELHSSYRIRGNEIVVVNRTMKDRRFTITVLESIANAEGKLLTTSFVVDYWDLGSGELTRSDATAQTWKRVGKFDLPAVTRIVTAAREKPAGSDRKEEGYTAKSLTLSGHKLLEEGSKK